MTMIPLRARPSLRRGATAALLTSLAAGSLAGAPAATAAEPAMPLTIAFQGATDARDNHIHVVGADGTLTYGTIRLTGAFEIEGVPVTAEVIGTSFYQGGTGPFTGALTLRWPNADQLGLRFDAVVQPAGEGTTVAGSVQVYGGTGVLADVTGSGTMTGGRSGPLGTPVDYRFTFDLAGLPDPSAVEATPVTLLTNPDAAAIDLMTAYSDMLVAKDTAGLDALLGDGFIIQRTDGSRATKADYLAKLPDLTSFSIADPLETRAGDIVSLAMVVTSELTINGKPYRPDPAPMLAVFDWNGTSWNLVSQGNFNLPQ